MEKTIMILGITFILCVSGCEGYHNKKKYESITMAYQKGLTPLDIKCGDIWSGESYLVALCEKLIMQRGNK